MSTELQLLVLRCRTLHDSVEFYGRLGLHFIEECHGSGPVHYSCSVGKVLLELYPADDSSDVDSKTRLGFSVADPHLLFAEIGEELIVSAVQQSEWGDRGILRDPDGRRVEIYG